MEFDINKCRTVHIVRGKLTKGRDFETNEGNLIESMHVDDIYKYLGFEQTRGINHTDIKKSIQANFRNRIKAILKTSLDSKNTSIAINMCAIPIIIYSAGIIKWSNTDLENLDRLVRTEMTSNRYHHPRSSIERINIPRQQGGRGILN